MSETIWLHIIDGPGATWGWIIFSIVGGFVVVYIIRAINGYDRGFAEGRATERREGIDQLRAQMAKVTHNQQQLMEHTNALDPQRRHQTYEESQ